MQVLVPYAVSDATLISSNVTETDYTAWSAATAYLAGDRVIRTQTHQVYERLVAGTSSTAPELDADNWLVIGATNRWAMFDQAVGSITTRASPITVQVTIGGPVDDIVLLGVTGTSVSVTLPDASRTVSVPAAPLAGGGSTVLIEGLASAGGILTLSITGTGTVGVGTYAAGNFTTLADPELGTQIGITDYSRKTFDEFGQPDIVRRSYARKLTVPVSLAATSLDQVCRILAALRSTPVLWRGVPWLNATLVYGFCKDWNLRLDTKTKASGSLMLESLAMGLV